MKTRVYLVDDHDIVRKGLAALLDAEPEFTIGGEASSAEQALREIGDHDVDIALVDITMGGASGLELIKGLEASHPDLPVLVISMHDESVYAERAIRAGARGYCSKDSPVSLIKEAVKTVMAGRIFLSPAMTTVMLERVQGGSEAVSPLEELTDRELEVFEHIGLGEGTREIAQALHLSVKTIESHRANIKRKLRIKSAPKLVRRAVLYVELG